ncbi:unnamed protein product [Oikopleura dioica]|uniref:GTP:AMP phosphotransferase, mitochondrial n=2 Tax=Oikopleura dioica TaxID=34765 RepID=E4WS24_OIKDI|nr:unnamed protein product [Oikopleura dioica]
MKLTVAQQLRAIIMGAPGSGKGTISARITENYGKMAHRSSGDMLRAQVEKGSGVGKEAKRFMDGGQLVPDHLVTKIVINEIPEGAFLLDGFPRTVVQAEELGNSVEVDAVIDLDVPFDVIEERLTSRWVHPGSGRVYNTGFSDPKVPGKDDVTGEDLIQRDDDKPETVQARLKVYEDTCGPLREFYAKQGKLHTFSGNATAVIWPQVEEFLKKAYKD